MLRPASAFLLISGGWNQWIRQQRLTLPRSWTALAEKRVASVTRVMPDHTKTLVSIFCRNSITVPKFKSLLSKHWPTRSKA